LPVYGGRKRGYSGGGIPGLTPMVQRIMIACAVVWILQIALGQRGFDLTGLGSISVYGVMHGYLWQPFTYMWLHDDTSLVHIASNMFTLWMFGGQLESVWGSRRFLRFYLICGVGAGLVILAWNALFHVSIPTLGASGAIFGLLTAFSLLWPDRTIMLLFPPIPIRAIWFIPVLFGLQLVMGGARNVSHIGHLGGVLVAGILLRDDARRALGWRSLSYRWHRMRMRNRLRAVRRDEWDHQRGRNDKNDSDRPTYH
jgi:membrane associated rhomboid family serine protease